MKLFDNGETILLGAEDALGASATLPKSAIVVLLAVVSVLASLAFRSLYLSGCAACVDDYVMPGIVAVVMFVLLTGAFLAIASYAADAVIAVVFNRPTAQVEIVYKGLVGSESVHLSFDDIRALRLTRGEWEGEAVKSMPVLHLNTGEALLVDDAISNRDFILLKTLTGIRGA